VNSLINIADMLTSTGRCKMHVSETGKRKRLNIMSETAEKTKYVELKRMSQRQERVGVEES